MAKLSDAHFSYTQSFLNQLQCEWKEFWFEVGQYEGAISDEIPGNTRKISIRENLVESLNRFNSTSEGNILIPVPLNSLKKLFSPSNCNADDVFKLEFFNEIKENLNLTNITCKKLRQLLLSDVESSLEYSDFPSPSIIVNPRKSAPPRLRNKKPKNEKLFNKNELNRIADNFISKEKSNEPGPSQRGLRNVIRTIIDSSDDGEMFTIPKTNVLKTIDKNIPLVLRRTPEVQKPVDELDKRRKLLSIKKTKRIKNNGERRSENSEGARYSSIYDLKTDSYRESESLFVSGRSQRRAIKPTIVCTYFSQNELGRIYATVKKLGFFEIENNVSSRTTHLICGSSKKTMNLCKAVARGCWILDKEWVFSSSKEGRWLYEERFEKYDIAPVVKENRLLRQKYGPVYRCRVLAECGSIYVSKSCGHPKTEDIKQLIILGGGHLTDNPERAKYIIGNFPQHECLKETWILSCIMQGRILNVTNHFKIV